MMIKYVTGKCIHGHVRSAPRSVHCEETQTNSMHIVHAAVVPH
jgi:hypothetical protein